MSQSVKDCVKVKISGDRIVDTIRNVKTGEVREIEHDHNLVVNNVLPLIMGLLKGDLQGIQYWAVGEGNPSWDSSPVSPTIDESELTNEVGRKVITSSNISFINPDTLEVSPVPTNCVLISCTFYEDECNGSWREFGIFGGNATADKDSGYMIDKKHHPIITKTSDIQIDRKIYITISFK